MARRADVVRESLYTTLRPQPNSLQAILLSPSVWEAVFWLAEALGTVMKHSPDPRVVTAGNQICRAVHYVTAEGPSSLPLPKMESPTVVIDKRRLLIQVQMLQQQLDACTEGTSSETRLRLQIKMETLLEMLATNT